jgi:AbrB family looped-hinge helix DNA binding protein
LTFVFALLFESTKRFNMLDFQKEYGMPTAIVSSKGQVTLPAAMRAALGITPGSYIQFEVRGRELVIKPELPMSAYYGMLKGYDLGDIEPEKEPDRTFE